MKKYYVIATLLLTLCHATARSEPVEVSGFTQLVKFTLKPSQAKAFNVAALESQKASILESGNLEMKLYHIQENSNVLYVYSRWKDKAAYAIHGEKAYTKKLQKLAQKAIEKAEIIELKDIQ